MGRLRKQPQSETGEPRAGQTDQLGDPTRLKTQISVFSLCEVDKRRSTFERNAFDAQTDSMAGHWSLSNICSPGKRRVLALFQFFDRLGPIIFEETRQRPVGQELAIGLTGGAIVGLVTGIDDALHL